MNPMIDNLCAQVLERVQQQIESDASWLHRRIADVFFHARLDAAERFFLIEAANALCLLEIELTLQRADSEHRRKAYGVLLDVILMRRKLARASAYIFNLEK